MNPTSADSALSTTPVSGRSRTSEGLLSGPASDFKSFGLNLRRLEGSQGGDLMARDCVLEGFGAFKRYLADQSRAAYAESLHNQTKLIVG